jgi:hypothetical protein
LFTFLTDQPNFRRGYFRVQALRFLSFSLSGDVR